MTDAATRPPELPGLTFIKPIGTGGFADVHLYQQAFPERQVAVKVLRETADDSGFRLFRAEANVMAQLSGHPSIVPIYQADVSADGRAYLVMEFCPPPHLAERFRMTRLGVQEVLDIAVRIASAVETAHSAGILHRDIKPHNILSSAYGAPLLTDFGIASATSDAGPSYGMSIPWSPPEAFDPQAAPDVRSDVYSLAATIYSLLAGRSPFEIPNAPNDSATLMHRIENQSPGRVLRADVPDSLNDLLARAMSRRIDDRPGSAMAFARAIQEVQIQQGLPPTRLEVMDASPDHAGIASAVHDARTQIKPISIIIPDAVAERGTLIRPTAISQTDDRTMRPQRGAPAPDTRHTRVAGAVSPTYSPHRLQPPPDLDTTAPPESNHPAKGRMPLVVGGIAAAAVVAGVVVAALGTEPDDKDPIGSVSQSPPSLVIGGGPAQPEALEVVRRRDTVNISWTNPSPEPGDTYRVETGPGMNDLRALTTGSEPSATVRAKRGAQLCLAITVVRDGAGSPPLEDCVIAP